MSRAAALSIADRHECEGSPIKLKKRTTDLRDAQAVALGIIAVRKEGCNGVVGKVWQGQEGQPGG